MRHFIPFLKSPPKVALVRLTGAISSGRSRLSDQSVGPILEKAFRKGRPDAVALVINSPGGSPAQSSLIAARIRTLADERAIPVHAFVEDVAASGGYWLASAADYIWADRSSIIGSIGVISAGFGLTDFIARHGIERRVHTSGRSKSMLDMFQPERAEDVARLKALQEDIHDAFIAQIKERRGARLKETEELFTGEFWLGEKAVELGLADGIAHVGPKLREIFGPKVRLIPYGPKRGLLSRFGVDLMEDAIETLQERAIRARFGL